MEESRGFDNTAVMGGLDRYIQTWTEEMTARLSGLRTASDLLDNPYLGMTAEERGKWAGRWRDLLDGDSSGSDVGGSHPPEAKNPQPSTPSEPAKKPAPRQASTPGGLTVDSPVDRLRGVDTKLAARFKRLEVTTVRDLLYLFPRRHIDYSTITKISEVSPDEPCTVVGTVWESRAIKQGYQGRRVDTEAVLSDESGNIKVVWFGQRHLARTLKPNTRIAISGKAGVFKGQLVFESPDYELLDHGQTPIHTGRLVPVYPLTEGLTARNVRRLSWQGLQEWLAGVDEFLPEDVLSQNHLMPLQQAVMQAHYPDDMAAWEEARRRLAFDELFTLQLAVLARRHHQASEVKGVAVQVDSQILSGFYDSLPFSLTAAQRRCVDQILGDLERGTPPMNRLLQGEVGSGKTVVALAALLAVAADGYQGAIMVPTEVLAEQHFQTVVRLLAGLARPVQEDNLISIYLESLGRPVSVGLLTGSTRRPVKRELTQMAAEGNLDLLMQRSALRERGDETPHALIMSATPIPRTLSLTLYGDLDISTIDELPAGRQQVATRWLPPERRPAAYGFMRKEVEAGRQGFVICPLVGESDTIESKAAIDEHKRLSEEVFPDLRVGLLHGRMPAKDKDAVMRRFREGEVDVLVSTAVVEVGIDVANATVMLIEGADRFGLAQLHQFRGRVGRGEHKSYCILLSESPSEGARERLGALEQIHDGFQLAEVDLELRGPGDFFGTRQSGLPNLRMAQLSDRKLLETARDEAARVRDQDPELAAPEHAGLAAQVRRFLDQVSAEGS